MTALNYSVPHTCEIIDHGTPRPMKDRIYISYSARISFWQMGTETAP